MAWKPRPPPTKTVDQAVADLLPSLPTAALEPADLETDEDVMAMIREIERQDPSVIERARLAVIRHRARMFSCGPRRS